MTRWLIPGDILTEILTADAAAGAVLKGAWAIRDPAAALAGMVTPVARYRSFAQFQADLAARAIDPAYRWVLYDPENWPDTPLAEQAGPWGAMRRFGQLAHASGYRVITAPARDLGNVTDSVWPKLTGETLEAWYLRTGLAGVAAEHGDVVDIQAQALTLDPAAYAQFATRASIAARTGNQFAAVLAGVSTAYGTAAQMAAAARSVTVDGYWLNVPGPAPDIAKAAAFLTLMGEA